MKSKHLKTLKTTKNRKITKNKTVRGGGIWEYFFPKKEKPQQQEGDVTTAEYENRINQKQKQPQSIQNSISTDDEVSTGEMMRRINANETLPKQQIISDVKQKETEGDPEYAGMIVDQKNKIDILYKKLIKIKLNTWSNTFYYKSVKNCKPDFSKLLFFLDSLIQSNFDYSYCDKILDIINVIRRDKYCFKLNKKLPSLLDELEQAIRIYIDQSNTTLDNENLTQTLTTGTLTSETEKAFPKYYSNTNKRMEKIEKRLLNNTRVSRVNPNTYIPISEGGKTRKHNKKMRTKHHTKSKTKNK